MSARYSVPLVFFFALALALTFGSGRTLAEPPTTSALPPPSAAAGGEAAAAAPAPAKADANAAPAAVPAVTPAAPVDPKVVALRGEVAGLMDDLVAARARAAVLGKALFKTRIALRVQNLAAPDPVLAKLVLSLDGAPVYHGDSSTLTGDDVRAVFEGFAAPGPHVLSVDVEQRAQGNAAYGYTLRETYRFEATREKETELTLVLDDDSNLASDFPDDGEGRYDVRTKLRVKTRPLGAK